MTFLEAVVAEKRAGLVARKAAEPQVMLAARVRSDDVRDFRAAIARPGAVIAELKAKTPTIDGFVHADELHALAGVYERNGAAAISIVTDPARFGTSLSDVTAVRRVSSLPVIAKDFVVDPYQILEARAAGADAILLIVRILEPAALKALHAFTRELAMHALVETHDESEIDIALEAGATIVGINNRNLDTMEVSLDTTRRLAHLVPDGVVLVAESGVKSRADVDDLAARGAGAFLVGGSLLSASDPGAKLRELTAAPRRDA
jgi:indole-3-glycerol phosphate synthase